MRYGHNKYIRNGEVQRFNDGMFCGVLLYGDALFDPHAMIEPHCIPRHLMGRPHEMVLHIAGVTYYPTKFGYERIEAPCR